jgi:hypothetical protein
MLMIAEEIASSRQGTNTAWKRGEEIVWFEEGLLHLGLNGIVARFGAEIFGQPSKILHRCLTTH